MGQALSNMMGKARADELGDAGHIDPPAICCEDSGLNWGLSNELHPSAETLDLSDRALVVSFQTVSSWRSSASNSTAGL